MARELLGSSVETSMLLVGEVVLVSICVRGDEEEHRGEQRASSGTASNVLRIHGNKLVEW